MNLYHPQVVSGFKMVIPISDNYVVANLVEIEGVDRKKL
jgi:hypothetical protein